MPLHRQGRAIGVVGHALIVDRFAAFQLLRKLARPRKGVAAGVAEIAGAPRLFCGKAKVYARVVKRLRQIYGNADQPLHLSGQVLKGAQKFRGLRLRHALLVFDIDCAVKHCLLLSHLRGARSAPLAHILSQNVNLRNISRLSWRRKKGILM